MVEMRALMAPRSVAVVGATERADASSSYVMRNLLRFGYQGRIVPIHPKAAQVFGIPAVASLEAVEPVDAVLIGIAAEHVNAALEAAGRSGARAAVVLASGFAEHGPAGAARQAGLREIAGRYGMAVCGPNCLGLVNLATGAALFSSSLPMGMPRGRVAIVSHSGATAIALANTGRFGLSHIVSSGNAAATDLGDYLDYLADDEATQIAALVLESIRDPRRISHAMARMHASGKRVIALRAGASARGARATAAHTGALAGSDDAFRAFFRRTGIIDVPDLDGLVETVELCTKLKRKPRSRQVAIVGVSGGGVAHVADVAEGVGLELAELADSTIAKLRALLPPFATPQNPLDMTGVVFADPTIYAAVLACLADEPSVGLIVVAQDAPVGLDEACAAEYSGIADAVSGFAAEAAVAVAFMSNLSSGPHPMVAARLSNVAVLHGTRAALTAINGLISCVGYVSWPGVLPTQTSRTDEALDWLPVPRGRLAQDEGEATTAAMALGFPVAMKIVSPDIAHKTEAGGVQLAIVDAQAAPLAFAAIMASVRDHVPEADLRGVWVEEMVAGGIEAVVGLVRHEPFGLGMVVGLGGVWVELLGDAAFDLLPIDASAANTLISRTRLATLLDGHRGAPRADRRALVELMVRLSEFAAAHGETIEALDLNPVSVLPDGRGVCVLDVLQLPRAISPA